jgi:hypothetical protein
MTLKIERGVKWSAKRVVIYGDEGIGKSTLAAQFPEPIILDTEDGTGNIDCARVVCGDALSLKSALLDLGGDPQGFRTVVIDSADWAERLILNQMLRDDSKKSVEDYGFGKGFVKLAESFVGIMRLCDQIIAKGVHVVLVAHATIKRVSPPDETDGYDRFELKLTKQTAPILKEWSDLLLFCTYRTKLVEGSDGRMKAQGGKTRVMHAERSAAWDAKNRFGLPAEMPMGIAAIEHLLQRGHAVAVPAEKPKSWRERIADTSDAASLTAVIMQIRAAGEAGKLSGEQLNTLADLVNEHASALGLPPLETEAANA